MAASSLTQAAQDSLERFEGPVRDHREENPLGGRVEAASAQGPGQDLVQPELPPQAVERPSTPERPRLGEAQLRRRGGDERLARRERPRQRADQAPDRIPVERVLAAEVVEHADLRAVGRRIPLVVGELEIADQRAVGGASGGGPQVHADMLLGRTYHVNTICASPWYLCLPALRTHFRAPFVLRRADPSAS